MTSIRQHTGLISGLTALAMLMPRHALQAQSLLETAAVERIDDDFGRVQITPTPSGATDTGDAVLGEPCEWSAGFHGPGVSYQVRALAVFDDGGGPTLYAGGSFTTAGDIAANHIARWDGQSWSALDTGMNSHVFALSVFDDGSGPALYAGGSFCSVGGITVNFIARWDGQSWSTLGNGMDTFDVFALSVFDDGGGPALYAGGSFNTAGGVAANYVARWDGETWFSLGSGMNSPVYALTVSDDGSGSALYAGGIFSTTGGVVSNRIAKWHCELACIGDLNGDGVVNAWDLALILGAWGTNPGHPADINEDNLIDAADLALLLGIWGPCPT